MSWISTLFKWVLSGIPNINTPSLFGSLITFDRQQTKGHIIKHYVPQTHSLDKGFIGGVGISKGYFNDPGDSVTLLLYHEPKISLERISPISFLAFGIDLRGGSVWQFWPKYHNQQQTNKLSCGKDTWPSHLFTFGLCLSFVERMERTKNRTPWIQISKHWCV